MKTADDYTNIDGQEAWNLINEYNRLCNVIKHAEREKEIVKEHLVAMLKDKQYGYCGEICVSNVPQKRITVNSKALAEDLPEVYRQYSKETNFFRFSVVAPENN
jgi:predicted phage-related endonuclease